MGKGQRRREVDPLIKVAMLARVANDKSQKAIAEEIGKSHAWVNQVENGWTDPTLSAALAYFSACGLRLEARLGQPVNG